MKITDFINEVSTDSPAPGGGSIAALSGSLSAALSSMVAALSYDKKGYENYKTEFSELGVKAQIIKDSFIKFIDEDTNAFNLYMQARRLPKKTEEEKKIREEAMEKAAQYAAEIPLRVLETSIDALKIAERVAEIGNVNSISDAGVAGWAARTAAEGAYLNVKINLPSITDKSFRDNLETKANEALEKARKLSQQVMVKVLKQLDN